MSKTLLVVDDESTTRRLVMFSLRPLNINVVGAEDGQQALEMANSESFDMILIDINLPGMDGFTLIQHLRELPRFENVPLVTFTARNHPDDEAQARELGAVGFLYKPFSTQELRAMVTTYLGIG